MLMSHTSVTDFVFNIFACIVVYCGCSFNSSVTMYIIIFLYFRRLVCQGTLSFTEAE